MKPSEQRIAIAEACGATWGHPVFNHDGKWHAHFAKNPFEFDSSWAGKAPPIAECVHELDIPDYLKDLNAMHEAEKVLNDKQCDNYRNELDRLCLSEHKTVVEDRVWHATAAQRAEAFLRTLGLWKDDALHLNTVDSNAAPRETPK